MKTLLMSQGGVLQVQGIYAGAHIQAYGSLDSNLQLPDSDIDLCIAFDGVQVCRRHVMLCLQGEGSASGVESVMPRAENVAECMEDGAMTGTRSLSFWDSVSSMQRMHNVRSARC